MEVGKHSQRKGSRRGGGSVSSGKSELSPPQRQTRSRGSLRTVPKPLPRHPIRTQKPPPDTSVFRSIRHQGRRERSRSVRPGHEPGPMLIPSPLRGGGWAEASPKASLPRRYQAFLHFPNNINFNLARNLPAQVCPPRRQRPVPPGRPGGSGPSPGGDGGMRRRRGLVPPLVPALQRILTGRVFGVGYLMPKTPTPTPRSCLGRNSPGS